MKGLYILGILVSVTYIQGEFMVPDFVTSQEGERVKLECKLVGNYRWYAISWRKIDDSGKETLIVTLPIDTREPDWNNQITKGRYSPIMNMNGDSTEFTLVIRSLECADRGKYVCNVVGNFPEKSKQTEIKITSLPEKPKLKFNELVIERNTSTSLTCTAIVGVPMASIVWLHKSKPSGVFEPATEDNVVSAVNDVTPCQKQESSTIEIYVDEESDGDVYRCALRGGHTEVDFYDEVTIKLTALPTEAPGNKGSSNPGSTCDGAVCILENKGPNNGGNSSPMLKFSSILLLLCTFTHLYL